jgi:lipopolysaccharide export system protein LptA
VAGAESGDRSKKIARNLKESSVSKSASASGGVRMMVQGEREGVPLGETSDQPIDITAKKVIAKKTSNGQEFVFEGSVCAKQGNLTLTCDQLTVLYEPKIKNGSTQEDQPKKPGNPKDLKGDSVFKTATASGNVKVTQNELKATAGKAVFDNVRKTITLNDSPKVWKGQDWMVAPTIVVYINEKRMETLPASGGDNGVKFLINPGTLKQEKEK